MSSFIEEFYYGNIDPQSICTIQSQAVQKQIKTLVTNEDLLTASLTDEEKKMFLDYVNAWGVVNGESNSESFITGFRLGAKFTFDTFNL